MSCTSCMSCEHCLCVQVVSMWVCCMYVGLWVCGYVGMWVYVCVCVSNVRVHICLCTHGQS